MQLSLVFRHDFTPSGLSRKSDRPTIRTIQKADDKQIMSDTKNAVGGGFKKILYALKTLKGIGIGNASKALRANNTCKACGLGMGGQSGGMTDEQGMFPSVCNKSVQAQSTDIQPSIPDEIFTYSLEDFRELTPHELEHIGRLGKPIYKPSGASTYRIVDWEWALDHVAEKLEHTDADKSFFYSSGRSSNEAGFVFQLLARLYGTNNVNNCSYYCHQATGVGLGNSIGTGTATVELEDLDKCDTIFLIGANPASNHPRLIYKLKACRERGGNIIVINPAKEPGLVKFAVPKSAKSLLTGGSDIATHYVQLNIGSDHVLLDGVAKALIEKKTTNQNFVDLYTEGFNEYKAHICDLEWDTICSLTGLPKATIEDLAKAYGNSTNTVFAWGMGITHHTNGVENVEAIANLALLGGMLGKPGAGLLPLRGHSNVQGIGTIGVKPILADRIFDRMQETLGIRFPKARTDSGLDTLACLEEAHAGNIEAAMIMGGNLYQATPNTQWAGQALDRVGFKCYLTTTLNYGHINGCDNSDVLILPVCARDEEPDATTQESMFNFVRLSDGGISRVSDARSETHILADIAHRLLGDANLDFTKFKSYDTVRAAIADIIPGMEDLKDISIAKREFHVRNRIQHTPEFHTESGKAQFCVTKAPRHTIEQDYPYKLASVRSEGQFNSIIYEEEDSYRGTKKRWSVLMNSSDIEALGKQAGDHVTLTSAVGEMQNVTVYAFDVAPGNVLAYYPEANCLIGLDRDPRSKTPAFKSVSVKIS